jgi:hypothetical protein
VIDNDPKRAKQLNPKMCHIAPEHADTSTPNTATRTPPPLIIECIDYATPDPWEHFAQAANVPPHPSTGAISIKLAGRRGKLIVVGGVP